MEEMLMTGVVTSTHGLKGAFKVYPTTDDPERFRSLKKVWLAREDDADLSGGLETEVTSCRFFKGRPILTVKAAASIEEAEKLKGLGIFVKREDAVPLSENEYFIADLLGSRVFTEDGNAFGYLKDVLKSAANDVYVVTPDGDEKRELYIPAVKDYVLSVDPSEKRLTVVIPKEI